MAEQYLFKHEDGDKFYYKDLGMTILHRTDGPAIEWVGGNKEWLVNGKLHRLDGPALEYTDSINQWYVNGEFILEIDKRGKILARMEEE